MNVFWDWDFVYQILPILAQASLTTLGITLAGFTIAALLGLAFAMMRMSTLTVISMPIIMVIEVIRSTPLLVQIFFAFFVLPKFGIMLDPFSTGIIVIGVHYATYCSEVYRAGIANISRGQWEAATALNLSAFYTWRSIIIPQAIPPVMPALGNYLIALFKETPLLSAIAVMELLQTAKIIGSETFRYTEPITLVGLFFLFFSLVSAGLIRLTELWLSRKGGIA